jgi:hypothetical protein
MTPKQPPRIATWMLKYFGCGPQIETILGDLAEQYSQTTNRRWYWRQTMKAIPVSFFREIRVHKWKAARSVLTGWFLWYLCVITIFSGLSHSFFGANIGPAIEPMHPIGTAWTFLWAPVGIPASIFAPFSFVYSVVLPFFAWAMCSGFVTVAANLHFERDETGISHGPTLGFHRDRQTAVVLLFAGSTLLLNLLLIGPFILHIQQQVHGPAPAYLDVFIGHLAANVAASVLGILFGGILLGGLLRDKSGQWKAMQ